MSEDIIKRLRVPPFGTETSERHLMSAAADEIERLRARVAELEAAHKESADEVYKDRETVTPDNAWEAFKRSNATVCRMADRSRTALKPGAEGEG